MSSTQEELQEMKTIVLEILEKTTKIPKRIFIGYDYFSGTSGSMSRSNPKIEIEWADDKSDNDA